MHQKALREKFDAEIQCWKRQKLSAEELKKLQEEKEETSRRHGEETCCMNRRKQQICESTTGKEKSAITS